MPRTFRIRSDLTRASNSRWSIVPMVMVYQPFRIRIAFLPERKLSLHPSMALKKLSTSPGVWRAATVIMHLPPFSARTLSGKAGLDVVLDGLGVVLDGLGAVFEGFAV